MATPMFLHYITDVTVIGMIGSSYCLCCMSTAAFLQFTETSKKTVVFVYCHL